jgi:phage-related holin
MSTGEKITSRKSLRTSYKIFVYSVAILTSHLVDKCFGFPVLEYWVIAYLTCSEAISNFENLFKIGFNTPSPTALKKKLEQFYQPKSQPKKP